MSNLSAKKVFIQIESAEEQQENVKNQRKTLKLLQGNATDKENLAGRPPKIDKLLRLKTAAETTLATGNENVKRKKIECRSVETQTEVLNCDIPTISEVDLTTDGGPSQLYWEKLAEKRREALEETLAENHRLHERILGLEEELSTSEKMLDETRHIVEVLKEILEEEKSDSKEEEDDTTDDEKENDFTRKLISLLHEENRDSKYIESITVRELKDTIIKGEKGKENLLVLKLKDVVDDESSAKYNSLEEKQLKNDDEEDRVFIKHLQKMLDTGEYKKKNRSIEDIFLEETEDKTNNKNDKSGKVFIIKLRETPDDKSTKE